MAPQGHLVTAFTELVGVEHPIVQTGMGYVAGAGLTAATSKAGGLGIIAGATLSVDELAAAIDKVKERTAKPFGVNVRADAGDAGERCQLLIDKGVKVASFALAPKQDLIKKLKDHGIVVMPSIGAKRHAEKVAAWGADAVLVQGGEGGGHTGAVATTVLLPQVVDAVDIPVVGAGGFFDGRGLAAALAFGAAGVGMGTRFLLTSDSRVPEAVKQRYLTADVNATVVTEKVDGLPHRMMRTPWVERVIGTGPVRSLQRSIGSALEFKKMSGMSWKDLAKDGLEMRKGKELRWGQMVQAANTPVLIRQALVEGDPDAGILPSGQVAGIITDLPSCAELIPRMAADAIAVMDRNAGLIRRD